MNPWNVIKVYLCMYVSTYSVQVFGNIVRSDGTLSTCSERLSFILHY
jgi:hypothetical protein